MFEEHGWVWVGGFRQKTKSFFSVAVGPDFLGLMSSITSDPEEWLRGVLGQFDCQTGTLHRSEDGESLDLVAKVGVPDSLLHIISKIPFGKGIAGAAAATREPVELCNLQEDLGGVAKEKARDTKVSGSLAVPIFSTDGGDVIGTLGIGKIQPYDFTDAEKESLANYAREVAEVWQSGH